MSLAIPGMVSSLNGGFKVHYSGNAKRFFDIALVWYDAKAYVEDC